MTAGNYNLNVWEYDRGNNKLRATDIQMGQVRRMFNCILVDMDDQYAYCGTTSGDLLQVFHLGKDDWFTSILLEETERLKSIPHIRLFLLS